MGIYATLLWIIRAGIRFAARPETPVDAGVVVWAGCIGPPGFTPPPRIMMIVRPGPAFHWLDAGIVFCVGAAGVETGVIGTAGDTGAGLALMLYVKFQTPIAFTWYVLIGTSATFLAGLAASLVWKEKTWKETPGRVKA